MRNTSITRRRALGIAATSFAAAGLPAPAGAARSLDSRNRSASHTGTMALGKSAFPRLALMAIGNPHNYHEAEYQRQIARFDLAVLGMYNGWAKMGMSPATAVAQIRSYSSTTLLANYTSFNEVYSRDDNPSDQYKRDKLRAERGPGGVDDWWAYDASGQHTNWSGGTYPVWETNISDLVTRDARGDTWSEWSAAEDYRRIIEPPGFDGWYSDNNFWRPRSTIDWNRDGTDDLPSDLTARTWMRNGYRDYYDRARQLAPNTLLIANADSDLDGEVFPSDADNFSQYSNVLHGAFIEHAFGKSWSAETWGGWGTMMGWYRQLISNLVGPKLAVLDAFLADPTDYQAVRYAFGSALLQDGYFSASTNYNAVHWYDEYDVAGTRTTSWLGAAVDAPADAPWKSGVYLRRFANGMVLVNPKGNGERTVAVPSGYQRFRGNQSPTVNNGQMASQVTLSDRDGLMLVRVA